MRTIIIHQHDPTVDFVGGIFTIINTFIKYAPRDFEIDLVGVTTNPQKYPVGRWHRIQIEGKAGNFFPLLAAHPGVRTRVPLSLRFTWALWRNRRKIDFSDAVLTFHRIEPSLAVRGLHNPKVVFIHGNMTDLYNPKTEVKWGRFPWLYFWLESKLMRAMSCIFTEREDSVSLYSARYPDLSSRVRFVPTWADGTIFRSFSELERVQKKQELAQIHGIDPTKPWVLFVGRFEGQKDPLLLLEAFRRRNGQGREAQLVMVGEGALESEIRHFITRHGLDSRVTLVGVQSQSRVAQWMNSAACLCMSSAFEGMPVVSIEALSCGLRVIFTDVGEVRRLIQDRRVGRLVREKTPEALAQAIDEVLEQPVDRGTCLEAVRPYSAGKILADIYAVYRELGVVSP